MTTTAQGNGDKGNQGITKGFRFQKRGVAANHAQTKVERISLKMQVVGGRGGTRTRGPLLAKQVLSQLSYTPTIEVAFILKHFHRFQNSFLRACLASSH